MSEDYQKGFKDGFKIGFEEGKKIVDDQWRLDKIKELEESLPLPANKSWPELDMMKDLCPKCGVKLSNGMGFVCTSPNCPTTYSGPQGNVDC